MIQSFYTVLKEKHIKRLSQKLVLSKSRQSLYKILVKDEFTFFGHLARWRPVIVLKINSHTDISQEFCQDFKQCCISFWKYQNTYFTESLSITAYDASSREVCHGLYNKILHVCRKCRKTWTDLPKVLINDIPPKKGRCH